MLTEDSVDGVLGGLVLGVISDETPGVGEGDAGRGGAVPMDVSNNLDTVVLPHADTRIARAEVDADRRTFALRRHHSSSAAAPPLLLRLVLAGEMEAGSGRGAAVG